MVMSASRMIIAVIRSLAHIPMLCPVPGLQILQIIGSGDSLGFGSTKEVLGDGISIVAERDFDGPLEAVDIAVVASSLVHLVLLHEGEKLFGGPAFLLEVVVVGG